MLNNMNACSNGTVKKSSKIVIMITIAVIVILIGIIVMMMRKISNMQDHSQQDSRATVSSAAVAVATEDNVEELLAKANKPIEDTSYICTMNMDWNFINAAQPSYNACVINSEDNTRTVYFDLALEENNEILYSSPYIPVGEMVQELSLNTELNAGTYPAFVVYHMVDDEHNEVGSVTVTVTLHIEN